VKGIFVLAEHRQGKLRDITQEMLSQGRKLSSIIGAGLTVILLGDGVKNLAEELARISPRVLTIEDKKLAEFNSEAYQRVLALLLGERSPYLTMIGHTAQGMDLAPSLATELGLPLATDCIDLKFEGEELVATRQIYGGKVNAEVVFSPSESYLVTIRPGAFSVATEEPLNGNIEVASSPLFEEIEYKRFINYVEAEASEVDISQADIVISIGRGIKDKDNIPIAEDLAKSLGGVLACSRPIVDKKWLSKSRQVGTSGKTVKPKVYLALGISGAFQHIAGMKNAGTIIAVNKDPKAPIFSVADYGVVDDLFKIVPALKERIAEIKGR
jgi:electron transfer flavoprotein alpha subunit